MDEKVGTIGFFSNLAIFTFGMGLMLLSAIISIVSSIVLIGPFVAIATIPTIWIIFTIITLAVTRRYYKTWRPFLVMSSIWPFTTFYRIFAGQLPLQDDPNDKFVN